MKDYEPNDPDSPKYKRGHFLLVLSETVESENIPADGTKSLENIKGLEELHRQLSKIGEYTAQLAYPLAGEFTNPSVKKLARTIEIRFKDPLSLEELRKQLPLSAMVESVDIPVSRYPQEQSTRLSFTS